MERSRFGVWARRIALALAAVLVVTAGAISWRMMNIIETDLLTPGSLTEVMTLEIASIAGSRVVFVDEGFAAVDGIWGVRGADGYGQMTRVISRGDGVERGIAVLAGSFTAGETVELDANAYPGDPREAHGLPFEEVRVPGELGVNPAWLITGEADTWVVVVHGLDPEGRAQSLRMLPTLRTLGFPVLVITYRNDVAATAGTDHHAAWGLDEWRDLEAALDTAVLRGAEDFVLVGHDMGASIISVFLDQSERAADVRGVVFDSAVLDLEGLADRLAADHGIPGPLAEVGKAVARIRFGLEWSLVDQMDRVADFDPTLPVLLLHGTADEVSPITDAEAFAGAVAGATLERFDGALHGALWNSEPVRYEDTVADFLVGVVPEVLDEG